MLPTVLSSHLPIPHTWEPPQLGPALALCLSQSQTAPKIPSSPNFSQSKAFPNHSNLLQKHLWRGCAWRTIPEMFCATSCLESCSLPHRDVPAPGTQLHLLPSEAQVGEFAAGFVGAVGALRRQVLGGDFSTQSLQLRLVTDLSRDKDKDLVTSMAVPQHSCPHHGDSLQQQNPALGALVWFSNSSKYFRSWNSTVPGSRGVWETSPRQQDVKSCIQEE